MLSMWLLSCRTSWINQAQVYHQTHEDCSALAATFWFAAIVSLIITFQAHYNTGCSIRWSHQCWSLTLICLMITHAIWLSYNCYAIILLDCHVHRRHTCPQDLQPLISTVSVLTDCWLGASIALSIVLCHPGRHHSCECALCILHCGLVLL